MKLVIFFFLCLAGCTGSSKVKAVRVAPAEVESTVSTISSGTVQAENQAVLNFGVAGRVAKVRIKAGDKVRRGQVIAELENVDLKVSLEESQKALERGKRLAGAR